MGEGSIDFSMHPRLLFVLVCGLASHVVADVYLHNPRGSNNRNCRNDNGERRRNGNRLFDSQNNDKGGYSCPRAYPFPAGDTSNAKVNEFGRIVSSPNNNHIETDEFFYYAGTEVHIEWTAQHACGNNGNVDCRIIIQYMCDTNITSTNANLRSLITNKYIRDGIPINNNDGTDTNDEATTTIPENVDDATCNHVNPANCKLDGRYGYHESHEWYAWCKNRERNYGLFTADQLPVTPNGGKTRAVNTRQNPNGNRRGLECPEERDYYPYWTPTMFKDVAVGVPKRHLERCKSWVKQSQNVVDKCYCDMTGVTNPTTPYPVAHDECVVKQGNWRCDGKWGLPEPECFELPYSRDNHLGNSIGGYPLYYNWTLPSPPSGSDSMRCFLRVRYNTTTGDFPETTNFLSNCEPNDLNCTNSPIADRENREYLSYKQMFGETDERYKLSFAVNTNQHSRTFQDRTYIFQIKNVPKDIQELCPKKIHNLNVRGKRGNIVQTYPAVEYDFVPQDLNVEVGECVHFQWIGSDYNPNRNPNDAEGGPYNPNNQDEAKADRSNLVQIKKASLAFPESSLEVDQSFFVDEKGNTDKAAVKKFAFLNQDIANCDTLAQLTERNPDDRQARERDPRNCGKLNSVKTPYFKGGVVKVRKEGSFFFMSTRNNNFSNRQQKLKIDVGQCTYKCGGAKKLSGGQIAGITIGVLAAASLASFFVFKLGQRKKWFNGSLTAAFNNKNKASKPAV